LFKPLSTDELDALAPQLAGIVREAGQIALEIAREGAKRWTKGDSSIVTEADIQVDRFLFERLPALTPDTGWLSEETADTPDRLNRERVWIVDPIDGTRAYVEGVPVWVVSVALVEQGRPVLAAIFNPTRDEMYEARLGGGARLNGAPIQARDPVAIEAAEVVGPRVVMDDLESIGVRTARASWVYALAYRLVSVAAGHVDAAIASARSRDWDIAAADLIMHEAGAALVELDGTIPLYNRAKPIHTALVGARVPLIEDLRTALVACCEQPRTWA
jgi:myo-inositol-1(or 4)-monophosphatase